MKSIHFQAIIAATASAFLMGTLVFFVRESNMSAQGCAFIRFAMGMVVIMLILGWRCWQTQTRPKLSFRASFSGVALSLCILFYFLAIQKTSVALAAFLIYLAPIFATFGDAIISRRLPKPKQIGLIFIAIIGLVIVALFQKESPTPTTNDESQTGVILALIGALCYSVYIILSRKSPRRLSILERSFCQLTAGTIILSTTLYFSESPFAGIESGWPYLLSIGTVHGAAIIFLAAFAMKHLKPIEFGTIAYLEPVTASLIGFLIYNESITLMQGVGFGLILFATLFQTLIQIALNTTKEWAIFNP